MEEKTEWCLGDFNAQDLANTAWAFATPGQLDARLFAVLARAAKRRVGNFNAQNLANTAWAFAAANSYSNQRFWGLRSPIAAKRQAGLIPSH